MTVVFLTLVMVLIMWASTSTAQASDGDQPLMALSWMFAGLALFIAGHLGRLTL